MSGKFLSKEKVTNSLRNGFDWSDQLLNEVVETVFNSDNEVPYSRRTNRERMRPIEFTDDTPFTDGSDISGVFGGE